MHKKAKKNKRRSGFVKRVVDILLEDGKSFEGLLTIPVLDKHPPVLKCSLSFKPELVDYLTFDVNLSVKHYSVDTNKIPEFIKSINKFFEVLQKEAAKGNYLKYWKNAVLLGFFTDKEIEAAEFNRVVHVRFEE